MLNRIQLREFLAWMTLAIAFILLSVTIAFAQSKSVNVDRNNDKVHIKINKIENGKTVSIDTTFVATDDLDIEKIISDLSGDENNISPHHDKNQTRVIIHGKDGRRKSKSNVSMDFDIPQMTASEKQKLHEQINESMKDMKEGLMKMSESLKSMHIHIDDNSDSNDFDFDFNFPDFDSGKFKSMKKGYSYEYSFIDDDEIDSLDDDDHVIVIGNGDEKPPVLEKVIKSKNGSQVFIYKRSSSGAKTESSNRKEVGANKIQGLHDIVCFPNPTSGKFKLRFEYEGAGDLIIVVTDSNSKEVFSEILTNFSGNYSKEIDLSGKSKGNYIVKIMQGEKSISKKVVLD